MKLHAAVAIAALAAMPTAFAQDAKKKPVPSKAEGSETPELSESTLAKWRDFIVPKPGELAWREIAWRSRLWDAVLDAQAQERPIIIWAMNGHPLGCT